MYSFYKNTEYSNTEVRIKKSFNEVLNDKQSIMSIIWRHSNRDVMLDFCALIYPLDASP